MKKVESHLKNIELDILSQLDIATNKNEKYMDIFQTIMDYKSGYIIYFTIFNITNSFSLIIKLITNNY